MPRWSPEPQLNSPAVYLHPLERQKSQYVCVSREPTLSYPWLGRGTRALISEQTIRNKPHDYLLTWHFFHFVSTPLFLWKVTQLTLRRSLRTLRIAESMCPEGWGTTLMCVFTAERPTTSLDSVSHAPWVWLLQFVRNAQAQAGQDSMQKALQCHTPPTHRMEPLEADQSPP